MTERDQVIQSMLPDIYAKELAAHIFKAFGTYYYNNQVVLACEDEDDLEKVIKKFMVYDNKPK